MHYEQLFRPRCLTDSLVNPATGVRSRGNSSITPVSSQVGRQLLGNATGEVSKHEQHGGVPTRCSRLLDRDALSTGIVGASLPARQRA